MKNKIISIFVAFMMLLPMSLVSAYGADTDVEYTDEYINASDVLLEVCPDMPFNAEGTYTRGEFIAAVAKLMKLPLADKEARFSDVPATHEYAAYINAGVDMGFISSGIMFYPDAPITYVQAIKIAATAVGYAPRADVLGGYPTGYIRAAAEAEIGDDLQYSNDTALSYADGAAVLYDMVTADLLQLTTTGDKIEYSTVEGQNILSMYHNILIAEGVVDANEFTGLYNKDKNLGEGKISIGGTEYDGGDFYDLIGQNARVFFKNDKSKTVIYAYGVLNEAHTFTPDYGLSINGQKLKVVPPEREEKEKEYKLDAGYSVIYNGKNLAAADFSAYVDIEAGTVAIIDNNEDGYFDVISIEEIEYGFIEKVNALGKKIYDKYKSASSVDMSDPDVKYYIYDTAGNLTDIEAIEANTVAGYVVSKDRKLVKVKLYDNAYGGTIEEKTSDGKVKIRGNYYELSDYYTSIRTLDELSLGTEVICYLGENDDIVYLEMISGEANYGFLVNVGTEPGLDSDTLVKLMTSDDGMIVLSLADKVNVNGTVKVKALAKTDIDSILAMADKFRAVKYSVNDEGKINKIFNAVRLDGLSGIFDEITDDDAPKLFASASEDYRDCYFSEGVLSPSFIPTAASSVIMIPQDAAEKLVDEKYEALTYSSFKKDASYKIMAYDVDAGGTPKFIIVYADSSLTSVDEYTYAAIIEKIYTTVDEEGNVVQCVKGFSQGAYQSFYVTDKTPADAKNALATVAPGDIIRITANSDDEVMAAILDYDHSAKGCPITGTASNGSNIYSDGNVWEHEFIGSKNGAKIEFINGYIYGLSGTNALVVSKNADLNNAISPEASIIVNLGRGTTVFVKINKDRNGNIKDAEIFTEPDYTTVETWKNAGLEADYMVSRQRFRQSGLNVIYVD